LYAIGSGGFFGKGLGQSLVKFNLPEPHNDYILAIIFEELGVLGTIILFFMFIYFLYRIFRVYLECKDAFDRYLVLSVFFHFALQIFLNIMVTVGILPTMGVTLPFISYGGSAVIFGLFEVSLVLSVSRQNHENQFYEQAIQKKRETDPEFDEFMNRSDNQKKSRKKTNHSVRTIQTIQ